MFKINNRSVQNKRTGKKFGPVKIIVLYLIRIMRRGNLPEKNNRVCTIIQHPRVSQYEFFLNLLDSNTTNNAMDIFIIPTEDINKK